MHEVRQQLVIHNKYTDFKNPTHCLMLSYNILKNLLKSQLHYFRL